MAERQRQGREQREGILPKYRVLTFIAHESAAGFTPTGGQKSVGAKTGGAAVVAEFQTRALAPLNAEVRLLSPKPEGQEIEADGYHRFFNQTLSNGALLENPLANDGMVQALQKEAVESDIIYTHYTVAGLVVAKLREEGKFTDKKFVYMGHTWDRIVAQMSNRPLDPVREAAECLILKHADRIVAATDAEREDIATLYADSEVGLSRQQLLDKISVTPLGVDTEAFNSEQRHNWRRQRGRILGSLNDTLNFYMVGRIDPLKGQREALFAFEQALANDPTLVGKISLTFVGGAADKNKGYEDAIRRHIESEEVLKSSVKFLGVLPPITAHAIGDVFLGPSQTETWYLAATEAMACGVPTILSDIPTLRQMSGGNTQTYADRSPQAFAQAIVAMAHKTQAEREELGRQGVERARQLSWQNSALALQGAFDSLYEAA